MRHTESDAARERALLITLPAEDCVPSVTSPFKTSLIRRIWARDVIFVIFELHLIASTWSLSHTVNALRKLVTYASFKRPAAVVPGAPLVEPVEIGICRFFAGVAALLVDVADCEAAPPRSLPENDSQIGRIGPRSIGIHKLQLFFIEFYKTGPVTSL
jgi:hypothetical protein